MAMGFDHLVRTMLSAPADAEVSSEMFGPQDVQIGDYTWDTDPGYATVTATWRDSNGNYQRQSRTFDNLPELFNTLREVEEQVTH